MPPESATKTAIRDGMTAEQWADLPDADGWGAWSDDKSMLAILADRLARIEWTLVAVNSEKGRAPKAPDPMPRPGIGLPPKAAAEKEHSEAVRKVAYLKALERKQGERPTPAEVEAVMTEMTGGSDV